MSENLFGLTVAADKGLDDLQCQRLLSENRKYQEVMLQYRCALKALESRLEILNEEFSLQHDRNPIESMKSRLKSPSSIMNKLHKRGLPLDFLVAAFACSAPFLRHPAVPGWTAFSFSRRGTSWLSVPFPRP